MFYVIYGWLDFEGRGRNPDKLFVRQFQTEKEVIEFDEHNNMKQYHVYNIIEGREQELRKENGKVRLINKPIITKEQKQAFIDKYNELSGKLNLKIISKKNREDD